MGLVNPKMELPTPKYCVTYARFTNRSNLRRAAYGAIPFFNARNGAGNLQNWVDQGCGVGDETGVGVGQSRPFCPESESELEPVKFYGLPTPARSRKLPPVNIR